MAFIEKTARRTRPWRVRWRCHKTDRIRSKSFERKPEAEQFRAAAEAIERETAIFGTFESALAAYLQEIQILNGSARTVAVYKSCIGSLSGHIPAELFEITAEDMRRWRQAVAAGITANTLAHRMKVIKTFFGWCVERGLCRSNPMDGVKRPKRTKTVPRWPNTTEVRRILEQTRAKHPLWADLITVAATTGMRRKEILGIRRSDIDLERRRLRVADPKGHQERVVDISAVLFPVLERRRAAAQRIKTPWIFCNPNEPDKPYSISVYQRLCRWLKAEGYEHRMHGFRHWHASQLAANGASVSDIQAVLGHVSHAQTLHYIHSAADRRKALVSAVSATLQTTGTDGQGGLHIVPNE